MAGGGWRNRSTRQRPAPAEMTARPADPVDVLVVGAGPTGLALAAQLAAFGATTRVVDRRSLPGRESRALVVQPRTLEVLRPVGVTQALLDRGDQAARVRLHLDGRDLAMPLLDVDAGDTSYPFLLVLRQAEIEAALMAHLAAQGLSVEWGAQLVSYRSDEAGVVGALRYSSGQTALVRARYLVGCDGADSTVRRQAGVAFTGGDYRRSVLLADIDVDGDLAGQAAHVFAPQQRARTRRDIGGPSGTSTAGLPGPPYREGRTDRLAGAVALDPLPKTMLSPKTKPKLYQLPLLCTS
jgi:2-polyprenyl-6-methoxyphenol hydroxylase-like FAD-dependent oxidoreductase